MLEIVGESTLSFIKETRSSSYVLAVCELHVTFQDMQYLTSTMPEFEYLHGPIHLQWIHVFHCIHNSHQCRHQDCYMQHNKNYYGAGRKSHILSHWNTKICLVFYYVAFSFASPEQNKKNQPSTPKDSMNPG